MREDLLAAARAAVEDCLALKPGETCLVLTDPPRENVGRALWEAARAVAPETVFVEMRARDRDGEEPPATIARLMREVDVVIAATTSSLTHTEARRAACREGARCATLPGIRETTMVRCLTADLPRVAARTLRVAERLTRGRDIHVRSAVGTDLHLSIAGVTANADTGLIHMPGAYGNLPAGEVYMMPQPGTARGRVVIDGSMAGIGELVGTSPIALDVEAGRVVSISGGDTARALEAMLAAVGPEAYTLAEFGVGTNDAARIVGSVLEDEKALGTVNVAVGNNSSMGGGVNVSIHLDGVLLDPDLDLDGEPFLRAGALVDATLDDPNLDDVV